MATAAKHKHIPPLASDFSFNPELPDVSSALEHMLKLCRAEV